MQRYNQSLEGIKRGTNTDITKVKAVSRIQLAGTTTMRRVGNANIYIQNINYRGADAAGLPLWRKDEHELAHEDSERGRFLGYWKGCLRLYGDKVITNKQDVEADTRYEIAKLVRAWPGFPIKTKLRLWDQSKSRHQACLEALQNLSNKENEKERMTKNVTRVINLPTFIINAPVTVLCLLPEDFPYMVEDDLKEFNVRRVGAAGRLPPNVHEFHFTVGGNLTLESFLRAWSQYQTRFNPFQHYRHPKFLQLLLGADPTNPLEQQLVPAGFNIYDNHDFHMKVSELGKPILGKGRLNGLYFQMVMHRYVPDHDRVNSVNQNAPVYRPLERYAHYDLYMEKTWPLPSKLKKLDLKRWIDFGNPDKVLKAGKLVAQIPSLQDQSEDDDSDDEEQRSRYLNRKARRYDQQFPLWRTDFLRAATHTADVYYQELGKIESPNVTDPVQLIAVGRGVERRREEDVLDQVAGADMLPNGTYLEQRAAGARMHDWYVALPNNPAVVGMTRAGIVHLAGIVLGITRTNNPGQSFEELLATAGALW